MMTENRHPIYQNALDAIRVGVEDFLNGDQARLASAVRNLTTGLLLLCKEKLRRLSPDDEILIWQKLQPVPGRDGGVSFEHVGNMTVDFQEIVKRFKSFSISADMRVLERVTSIRNQLEHHYVSSGQDSVREAFVDGFQFLKDFLPKNLGVEAWYALGEDVWEKLLEQNNIYQVMGKECTETFKNIDWSVAPSVMFDIIKTKGCQECKSLLLRQRDISNSNPYAMVLECEVCGMSENMQIWSSRATEEYYFKEMYIAMSRGGEIPYTNCPECGIGVYVYEFGECFSCGFSLPEDTKCRICGELLSLDEYAVDRRLCLNHQDELYGLGYKD